jgi:adenosylcobinamide-GDP ribazoletransferase
LFGGLFSRLATVFYRHLLCGITGDTLGATNELIEVSFVLLMPLLLTLS